MIVLEVQNVYNIRPTITV